jgi:hypothetical protein
MAKRLTGWFAAAILMSCVIGISAQVKDTWSAAGITGIVDESDMGIHQFNTTGSVSIKASVANGTLDIRFPVQTMPNHSAPQGACTELRALLRDPGPGSRVIVRLMQLGIKSGFDGELTSLVQIDSDTTPRLSRLNEPLEYAQYRACFPAPPGGQPFDYDFFTYYVEAQLIKTSQGGNPGPGLMAVQICHTEEQCEP